MYLSISASVSFLVVELEGMKYIVLPFCAFRFLTIELHAKLQILRIAKINRYASRIDKITHSRNEFRVYTKLARIALLLFL